MQAPSSKAHALVVGPNLNPAAGYPSNHGILKSSCVTWIRLPLLYPSRTQEGPIPSLSWLRILDDGCFAWIDIRKRVSYRQSLPRSPSTTPNTEPPSASCPEPASSISTTATTPSSYLTSYLTQHLQIGISFPVLHAYRQYRLFDIRSVKTCKRSLPGTTTTTATTITNTSPSWRCLHLSRPCTRRPSPAPGDTVVTCHNRSRCLEEHTAWVPRASTSATSA